jgi:PPOX class probable F420-dependent enzyme
MAGKVTVMTTTIPASHRDLLEAQVATLSTIGPDGRPQVSALWFVADEDDTVRLSLNESRQKTKNLEDNPAATLFVLDPDNPMRYLEIRADAKVEPDPDRELAQRVGAKYDADLSQMDQPGEQRVAVILHPVRVNAVDLSA